MHLLCFLKQSPGKMAALPTQQPQFMTTGDSRTHPNEALIDNIEYDQIVVPDVSISFFF